MSNKSNVAALFGLGLAVAMTPAAAFERGYAGFSVNPGVFLNTPATTPPPGAYGSIVSNVTALSIQGPGAAGSAANGNQPTRQFVSAPIEVLTYVPGFKLLGGDYSFIFAQQENVNTQVTGGTPAFGRNGFHNSAISQALGYKLGDTGFYAKFSFAVVIPDGTIDGSTGNGLGNTGVPFTTLRPGLGIQYISHGWSFVNNLIAEYNTVNPDSGYQTGTILRDEASFTKTFGRLTLGPSLGWIGQITNDTSSKFYNFAINTNRYSQVGVGGFIGYDFGPVSVAVFGLQDVLTYASGGTPSTVPATRGRDTAITTGGQTVYATVSFKIPGIGAYNQPLDFSALRDSAIK